MVYGLNLYLGGLLREGEGGRARHDLPESGSHDLMISLHGIFPPVTRARSLVKVARREIATVDEYGRSVVEAAH